MPHVNVQLPTKSDAEQTFALMRGLGQAAMNSLGVPELSIHVILTEVAPEHWGVGLKT